MARPKKRSEVRSEADAGLIGWIPGVDTMTRLLPTRLLSSLPLPSLSALTLDWLPFVTRSDLAELSDRLIRLERRLAEHERAQHAAARTGRQSLSA